MRLVLDASAAVLTVLSPGQARRFASALENADEVLAPELLVAEVTNTIWKYHQFERLSVDVCDRSLELALELVDRFVPGRELHREAFLLARTTRRSAYDMFYLALARREDALLLTGDAALRREAEHQGIRLG